MRGAIAAVAVFAIGGLTACGGDDGPDLTDEQQAGAAVERFAAAWRRGDGEEACSLLHRRDARGFNAPCPRYFARTSSSFRGLRVGETTVNGDVGAAEVSWIGRRRGQRRIAVERVEGEWRVAFGQPRIEAAADGTIVDSSRRSRTVNGHCPRPGRYQAVDPREALALGPGALAMARREAVRDAKRRPGADASGARAKALLASRDEFWARSVEHLCGPQLVDRTVVVLLHFPVPEEKYGSASLSQGRVFVARFGPHRYRVWWVHH